MSDLSVLPVAPEFTDTLCESAVKTLIEYLTINNVPQSIINLAQNIADLGYYQAECYRAPETLLRERNDRLDIEMITIETINLIAANGGEFKGPWSTSVPREIFKPVKVRKG